ncbi:23S rRNA (adenine(1618)-N(6))-methyltransferase RlmF [Echinimonas agarilytica]|uniref:Ribosomal RNA large subunit methyltransferase F n=1 Tax=Echinimonas agarilytica TaxID=1215918 RepID=A0AA42B7W7_9GAMM|nr:23S rRNA (adenine(1618)-N(6))-methyltransferase RlmF [Echinimonas agarilytica]MCM2680635.1 23S rRNA (adenine(1618)-N(6))-methyltransferase RlmF [Echinimonas agarilytica]
MVSQALHCRNPHRGRYDFNALVKNNSQLKPYVIRGKHGELTIDFANADAVLALNKALLNDAYQVVHWQIPSGYLCPPIPGRADYIHHIADLLTTHVPNTVMGHRSVPTGSDIRMLDIGTGANCIYPIIASQSYGWKVVGTEVDAHAFDNAKKIVSENSNLSPLINIVRQKDPNLIFEGIIRKHDKYHVSVCNPPFHRTAEEAIDAANQKWLGVGQPQGAQHKAKRTPLNFGGQATELWCQGGELSFLKRMATESRRYANDVCWFTSLVSKNDTVRPLKKRLKELDAETVEVIQMSHGNKITRVIVWSFVPPEQRKNWAI